MFKRLLFLLIPFFFLSIFGFSKEDISLLYRKLNISFRYNCRGFGGLQAIPQGVIGSNCDEKEQLRPPEGRSPYGQDSARAKRVPILTAESAIIMNPWTKRILYSKNPQKTLSPASTAKIMSALVVLKNSHLNKKVVVSRFASSMEPSKVHIKEGELYHTGDLLKALLLNSGNDASVALAESVAGSEEKFVEMMNKIAKAIGARSSNFENSSGLPVKGQYSTAYDLSLIVREVMKDRRFVDIIKMKRSEIEELGSERRIKLRNHNKSLWKDTSYLVLGKTGYTKKAKHCFAGYIQYNRWRKVIVVILGSKKLWRDLELLAERGI